jgi:hypothetical protein
MPITAGTLSQFHNDVFIETGVFMGDGIAAALDAGFMHVWSVEVAPTYYQHARRRFEGDPRVEVFLGSSLDRLPELLAGLTVHATFWLDSHYCGRPTGGAWACPLLGELALIGQHPIKTHTILIDDRHLQGLDLPAEESWYDMLRKINPDYRFSLAPSAAVDLGLDIVVAQP